MTSNTRDFTTQMELCVGIIGDLPFLNKRVLLLLTEFIYGSAALVDLGRFFSFLIYTQQVILLGRRISPSQGRYLRTEH
jgi:hypothetical protein